MNDTPALSLTFEFGQVENADTDKKAYVFMFHVHVASCAYRRQTTSLLSTVECVDDRRATISRLVVY